MNNRISPSFHLVLLLSFLANGISVVSQETVNTPSKKGFQYEVIIKNLAYADSFVTTNTLALTPTQLYSKTVVSDAPQSYKKRIVQLDNFLTVEIRDGRGLMDVCAPGYGPAPRLSPEIMFGQKESQICYKDTNTPQQVILGYKCDRWIQYKSQETNNVENIMAEYWVAKDKKIADAMISASKSPMMNLSYLTIEYKPIFKNPESFPLMIIQYSGGKKTISMEVSMVSDKTPSDDLFSFEGIPMTYVPDFENKRNKARTEYEEMLRKQRSRR